MADMNNLENIQESFEYITEVLDSMRAQNAINAGSVDKVLTNINTQIEKISDEENSDLIKLFLAELKRSLDERHGFVSSKFSEIESSFNDILQKTEGTAKTSEIREVFEIIANNLNIFGNDFAAQREIITEIGLKIEDIKQDDSQKVEILKNISVLKLELEKFSNGLETIIVRLNDNFKELGDVLQKLDSSEALTSIKKEIGDIFLSSNAVLSTLQVIDRKNRELEEVINHVVTKEDFQVEREQVAKLIAQNLEITDYINSLPTQTQFDGLTNKVENAVIVINALKNLLSESGKQNQEMLTAQLQNLETKILNISTEEEFIGFRKELAEFAQGVIQNTNLMRADLSDTNSSLKDLMSFLSSMDIKNSFENFANLTKVSETNVKASVSRASEGVIEEITQNRNLIKADAIENVQEINKKIEASKEEITETSKSNLANIVEHVQSVINNIFSVKNALHIENVENTELLDNKLDDLKEDVINTSNFVVKTSQDSFNNLLSVIGEFSNEISHLKENLNQTSEESSESVKNFFENLSEKLGSLEENLTKINELNNSDVKVSLEELIKTTQNMKSGLEQSSNTRFAGLRTNIEELTHELQTLKEGFDLKNQSRFESVVSLFDSLSKDFLNQKELFSETSQLNFEAISLQFQNLSEKMEETKAEYSESLRSGLSDIQISISEIPQTIKSNQANFNREIKNDISALQGSISSIPETIKENQVDFNEGIKTDLFNLQDSVSILPQAIKTTQEGITETLHENFSELKGSISTLPEMIKENQDNLSEELKTNISDIQVSISDLPQTIKTTQAGFSRDLKSDISGLQGSISAIPETIRTTQYDLNENLRENFSEIKGSISTLPEVIKSTQDVIDENLQTSLSVLQGSISTIPGILKENQDDFNEELQTNLSDLQGSISALPETIKANQAAFEDEKRLLIEENSRNIEEVGAKVQNLIKGLIAKENPFKGEVLYEFADVKTKIESIKEEMNQSNLLLGENVEIQIKHNLESIEEMITSGEDKYTIALLSLQNRLVEYLELIQNTTQESDLRLNSSVREVSEIKTELKSIVETLPSLDSNEQLSILSSDISKKLEGILLNITQMEEISTSKNRDGLQKTLEVFEENFDGLSAKLQEYTNSNSDITNEFVENLNEKLEALRGQVNLINTDIVNVLNTRANEITSGLLPINEALNKLSGINFEELLSDIKNQLDTSYFSITSVIKEGIKEENAEQLHRLSENFEALQIKMERVQSNLSTKSGENLEELKTALEGIAGGVDDFSAMLDEKFVDQFGNIENSVLSIKDHSNDILDRAIKTLIDEIHEAHEIHLPSDSLAHILAKSQEEFIEKLNVFEDNLLQTQEEVKTVLLTEIQENIASIRENYYLSTQALVTESIERVTGTSQEELFEKIELVEEKIIQKNGENSKRLLDKIFEAQEETKNTLLDEFIQAQDQKQKNTVIELAQAQEDCQRNLLDEFVQNQDEIQKNLLEEILQAQNENKQVLLEDFIQAQEENQKILLNGFVEAQDETKTAILDELIQSQNESQKILLNEFVETQDETKTAVLAEFIKAQEENNKNLLYLFIQNQESTKNNLLEDFTQTQDEKQKALLNSIIESQDATKTEALAEFIQSQEENNKNLLASLTQNQESTKNDLLEDFIQNQNENNRNLLSAMVQNLDDAKHYIIEDVIQSQSENKQTLLDEIVQNQDEVKAALLEELKESIDSVKETLLASSANETLSEELTQKLEDLQEAFKTTSEELEAKLSSSEESYKNSTQYFVSETIEKALETSQEELFEKIDLVKNKIIQIQDESQKNLLEEFVQTQDANQKTILDELIQAQNETKTALLEELKENIESVKKGLSSAPTEAIVSDELSQKIEDLQEAFNTASEELKEKISSSEEKHKTSTQALLSEIKTSFYEKVEDSLDDLRSFIEILENKNDNSVYLDDMKSELFEKFTELADSFETSFGAISVKKDMEDLSKEIEGYIGDLFEDVQEKFASSIEENETIKDVSVKTDEINRRVEELKNVVTDEITEKLAKFELDFDNQTKDFSSLMEEIKTSLAELKENYIDLSVNSTMEMSNLLMTLQEKIDTIDSKIENHDFGDIIESSKNELKTEIESINQAIEQFGSNDNEELKESIQEIKEKLEGLNSDSNEEFRETLQEIKNKLEGFNIETDDELKESLNEIKEMVQSQNGLIEQLKGLEQLDNFSSLDGITDVKSEFQEVLKNFEEKINGLSLEQIDSENQAEQVKTELQFFKKELFSNLVDIFNQISFVVEAEDIKDFVEEKTGEIKDYLKALQKDGSADEYSYTLQDVESDIAKLRLILNDMVKTKPSESFVPESLGNLDKLNEDIMSLSSRTNKLLLSSDESHNSLKSDLSELTTVAYQLEAKLRTFDSNKENTKIEQQLENINNLVQSSVRSDKVFNQTFMYLAEWVDKAGESIESIHDKVSNVEGIKQSINDLKKSMPKRTDVESILDEISEKFDRQQDKINSLEEKMESLLSIVGNGESKPDTKLTKKIDNIDKQLAKLTKGIEKISSYVDEG